MQSYRVDDHERELRGLRERNRVLENELHVLQVTSTCGGPCQTCCVNFTTPGLTHSSGQITLTWASVPGMIFQVDSSPDNTPDSWTVITETLPAGTGETTTLTIGLPDGAPVVYYRVREAPVNNEC